MTSTPDVRRRALLGGVLVGGMLPPWSTLSLAAGGNTTGNRLIVVILRGGMDGLSAAPAVGATSWDTSCARLCPFANRRPSASTNPSYRSRPLAWAAGCAASGSVGVTVSQNRTNSANASFEMVMCRSSRSTCRVNRSNRRPSAASIRSELSGER